MTAAGLTAAIALTAVALLHAAWGLRLWWPVRDEAQLARTVVGRPGILRMPGPGASFAVALALAVMAAWLLAAPDGLPGRIGTALIAAIFLLRGLAPWTSAFRRLFPEQPFATLDRRVYGPACLAIGALTLCHLLLTIKGSTS
jgi:hypothetical protein